MSLLPKTEIKKQLKTIKNWHFENNTIKKEFNFQTYMESIAFINQLAEISEKNNHNELLKRFISFIIKKRRFFYVEKIFKDFLEVCSKSRGEINAELMAAKELNGEEITKVKNELAENFGSNIKLNYKHDPSLIGGLVIKVGSTMVDTSIKNKLHQIQKQMIEA